MIDFSSIGPPMSKTALAASKPKSGTGETPMSEFGSVLAMETGEQAKGKNSQELPLMHLGAGSGGLNQFQESEISPLMFQQEIAGEDQSARIKGAEVNQQVLSFMDSLESDLGISPARLVGAMANLSSEELGTEPEDIPQVLSEKLGLEDDEKMEFEERYLQIFGSLNPEVASEALKAPKGALTKDETTALLAVGVNQQQSALNQSLDRMADQFFMKGDYSQSSMGERHNHELMPSAKPEVMNLGDQVGQPPITESALKLNLMDMENEGITGLNEEPFGLQSLDLHKETEGFGQESDNSSAFTTLTENSNSQSTQTADGGELFASSLQRVDSPASSVLKEPSGAISMGAAAYNSTEESAEQNISNMIHQARFIAKQGGGDMKVHLTPEGLGQVSLKVSVDNGVVNVEMQADSAEARQLLEKHVDDLRVGLLSSKINLNEIRIDSQTGDFGAQDDLARDHQRQEQNEHLARQFMNEFRNQNERNRNGHFELPAFKAYGRNRTVEGLRPIAEQGQAHATRSSEGGRIHYVA